MPVHNSLEITAMQTVLKNPKLKKLVMDGLSSPIGSTKRSQAKKVISSIYTLKLNHHQRQLPIDTFTGQGGPSGNSAPAGQFSMSDSMGSIDLPTMSLKPSPKRYNFRQSMNMQPPSYSGKGGNLDSNTGFFDNLGSTIGDIGKNIGSGVTNTIFNTIPKAFEGAILKPLAWGTSALSQQFQTNPDTIAAEQKYRQGLFPTAPATQFSNLVNSAQSQNTSTPGAPPTGFVGPINPNTSTTGQITPTGNNYYGPPALGQTSQGTPTSTGGSPLLDYLQQAVGQGVGANAFANKVYSDMGLLKDFYGPDVPVDQMPVGSSLTGQIEDLYKRLNEEQGLNALHQSFMDAYSNYGPNGTVLRNDAEAYIQGKDQYLNQIDQMLTNAQNTYANDPMSSDPWYASALQNYMTYLTTLRGRTTQRYTSYVNATIDRANAQLQALESDYNAKSTAVQNLFNTQSQITIQQYNETKQTLVDMYNNLAQQSGIVDTSTKDYWDIQNSQLDAEKKIVALNSITADQLKLIQTQVANATTLDEALRDPILATNQIPANVIASQYVSSQINKYKGALAQDPSSFPTFYNTVAKEKQGIIDQIQYYTQLAQQTQDPTTSQQIQQGLEQLHSIEASYVPFDKLFEDTLKDYIGGTQAYTPPAGSSELSKPVAPSKLADIQNALNDMTEAIVSGKVTTYEQWAQKRAGFLWNKTKEDYYKQIDPAILRLLFDAAASRAEAYHYDQQSGGTGKVSLDWKGFSADDLASKIYAVTGSLGI